VADVSIEIDAKDMATKVLGDIAKQTEVMSRSVTNMSKSVTVSTQTMAKSMNGISMSMAPLKSMIGGISSAFNGLVNNLLPLITIVALLKAQFAVFNFAKKSITEFIEAGSPAGKELEASLSVASQAIDNLMQTVGAVLAPAVQVGAELVTQFAQVFSAMLAPSIDGAKGMIDGLRPTFDAFAQNVIAAIAAAEVGFGNLGSIFELAKLSLQLRVTSMIENIKYAFTEVMPAYLKWFGDNAYNLVRDAAVGIATILQNLGTNLGEFGAAVYSWVTSGMQGGIEGLMGKLGETMMVGLTDGFEAKTQALPDIAARALSAEEKNLALQMGAIGGDLAGQFNDKFKERVGQMSATVSMPELAKEAGGEETAKKLTSGLTAVADSQSQIAQQLSATESRLLTRGPSEGPMQSVAQASQKTAEAAEKTQQSSDRMVELLEQLVGQNFVIAEAV
jgi:hypothetical protein